MTTAPGSMRFAPGELLSGMFASIEGDGFDDDAALCTKFDALASRFPLFGPLASAVDPKAVEQALAGLEAKGVIERVGGRYQLTESGRTYCTSSKRTLFNKKDREQLEEAGRAFETL